MAYHKTHFTTTLGQGVAVKWFLLEILKKLVEFLILNGRLQPKFNALRKFQGFTSIIARALAMHCWAKPV